MTDSIVRLFEYPVNSALTAPLLTNSLYYGSTLWETGMNTRTVSAIFVALAFALFGATTSALGQDAAPPASNPSRTTTLSIRCDGGKTTVVQNRFVSETGATSAVITVTPESGTLYTVAFINNKVVAQTLKQAGSVEAEPVDLDVWLFLVDLESPNYMLLARRQPNDCRKAE